MKKLISKNRSKTEIYVHSLETFRSLKKGRRRRAGRGDDSIKGFKRTYRIKDEPYRTEG